MMINRRINQAKGRNFIHTICLLSFMAVLLSLIGWMIFGVTGVWAALFVTMAGLIFTPTIPSRIIMKLYGARPMAVYNAPGIYRVLESLTRAADLEKMPKLYYLPHKVVNAFAAGNRQDPAIALSRGLLDILSPTQISGILAHEISHIKNNDTKVMAIAGLFQRLTHFMSSLGLLVFFLLLPMVITGEVGMSLSTILVMMLAPNISALVQLALSRTREFEADLGSSILMGSPYPLVSALKALDSHKKRFFGHPFVISRPTQSLPELLSTHPDIKERIERLISLSDGSENRIKRHSGYIPALFLNR